jgi:hypothetical protein
MTDRSKIIEGFPQALARRPSFHDLAKAVFKREQADRFMNIERWTDVIDVQLNDIGGFGIGPLLSIMPAKMAVAFLPAWLVIGVEYAFPRDGVISALGANLDPLNPKSDAEEERFQNIYDSFTIFQRDLIAETMREIADLNFRKYPDAAERFYAIASHWSQPPA